MNAQARYFGAPDRPVFGWLHPGAASAGDVGVVLCSPWGREEVSAHLTIRAWAKRLSQTGWPTLRFDYVGEGDSAGDPLQDGSVDAWVASVRAAMDELKQQAGVSQICLMGIRVGATLACLAAQGRTDVLGLVALAPVIKGRAYVRELTALQAASSGVPAPGSPAMAGVFQSGGYAMSQGTCDALLVLDLVSLPQAPAPHILLIDRDDMPVPPAWATAMKALGAQVQQQALPGYAGMMDDPHHVVLPVSMIEASVSWLSQLSKPLSAHAVGEAADTTFAGRLAECRHKATLVRPAVAGKAAVQEMPVVVPGTPAFGMVASPVDPTQRSGHAILLLNAGSTRRIGPGRMSVDLARAWAAQGHVVLRLDLAGLGDSEPREGCPVNQTYPVEAMADVAAAIGYLRTVHGARQVHACGLCAGAYHGLKAARDGLPLASLMLINPLIYFNAEGLSLEASAVMSAPKVHFAASAYRQSALSADKWLKLIKGQVHFGVMFQVLGRRAMMVVAARWRQVLRALHWPLTDDLVTTLRRLSAQGVRVHFLFAEGDPGLAMLKDDAGGALPKLCRSGLLGVDVFEHADHVFTHFEARQAMLARAREVMDAATAHQAGK